MNRDVLGFLLASGLLFLGYMFLSSQSAQKPESVNVATQEQVASPTPAPAAAAAPAAQAPSVASADATATPAQPAAELAPLDFSVNPADLSLDLSFLKLDFLQNGGCLGRARLGRFHSAVDNPEFADVILNHHLCKGFGFRVGTEDLRTAPAAVSRPSPTSIRLVQRTKDLEVARTFTFAQASYKADLVVEVRNLTASEVRSAVAFELGATSEEIGGGGLSVLFSSGAQNIREAVYQVGGDVTRIRLPFEDAPTASELAREQNVVPDWVASGTHYFLTAALPKTTDPVSLTVFRTGFNLQKNRTSPIDQTVYETWVEHAVALPAQASKSFSYDVYLGPKLKSELSQFAGKDLTKAIDYGFFQIVAWPIFYALDKIQNWVRNWGLAIIILTAIIKLAFYPLTLKAYIAGKKMQKIQPELNAIKEKHKDDRQKQSQEVMALMAQKGANPMSGCLPILPQMPVFFALYAVFQNTFELRHAPFFLWINDLSAMDPYFISPLLMAVLMYLQQKLTPMPTMDPAQAKMMQFLPIFFALLMFSLPSGLVLYMITNTTISIIQQQYMLRKYKEV